MYYSQKKVWIVSFLVLLALAFSLYIQGEERLRDIVFVDHYYDIDLDCSDAGRSFYYVTYPSDDRKVVLLSLGDNHFSVESINTSMVGRHKLVFIKTQGTPAMDLEAGDYDTAHISFNSGESGYYPIGRVLIRSLEKELLKGPYHMSSTLEGGFSRYFSLDEPVTLIGIERPFVNEMLDPMGLIVSEDPETRTEDFRPLDQVDLGHEYVNRLILKGQMDKEVKAQIADPILYLVLENREGEVFYADLKELNHMGLYSTRAIEDLLIKRGAYD